MNRCDNISDPPYGWLIVLRFSRGMNVQFPPLLNDVRSYPKVGRQISNEVRQQRSRMKVRLSTLTKARPEERRLNSFSLARSNGEHPEFKDIEEIPVIDPCERPSPF